MISEIKRRLGKGEIVELECIAPAEFIEQHEDNKKILALRRIAIMSYQQETGENLEGFYLDIGYDDPMFLEVARGSAFLTIDEMKYFDIKRKQMINIKEIREKALRNYSVEIIKDSIAPNGCRLTTMKLVFPRFILAQFNTHRVISKNASSSRAIPFNTMVNRIIDNTAIPFEWGLNRSGMQADEVMSDSDIAKAYHLWIEARDNAICTAKKIHDLGLHKQHVNRLLEPFMLVEVLATATEWDNFFTLRCHEDAQPDIQHLAKLMRKALGDSKPENDRYHIPFLTENETDELRRGITDPLHLMRLSVARCARVSYTLRNGTIDECKDIALHDRLVVEEPLHASPSEHQAVAMRDGSFNRNLRGWSMYRNKLEKGEF